MQRLREARKSKNMTMKQLGMRVGLSESTISLYENGKHEPDHATLIKLAHILGVSIDYLLGQNTSERNAQPTGKDGELDAEIVNLLTTLSPDEIQRVQDFVSGLKASRGDVTSPRE